MGGMGNVVLGAVDSTGVACVSADSPPEHELLEIAVIITISIVAILEACMAIGIVLRPGSTFYTTLQKRCSGPAPAVALAFTI